ncbi:MAG: XrtA/PEP-CTERM system TPR-repeat protein PrsT [Pseudomonadales bacterium]
MGAEYRLGCCLLLAVVLAGCDSATAEQHVDNAQARLAQDDVRTAVIELKNALQKEPDLAQARLMLGEAHARLGDHPSALKEFERALDLGLDDPRVQAGLLRSKVRLGRYQEVIGALEDAGALTPEFAVILADANLEAGDLGRAKALYQQGLALADGNLGLGLIAWQEGDLERAEHYLTRAVTLDPGHADAWLRKGEFSLAQQAYADAEQAFDNAAALAAGQVLGRVGLARVHLVQGDLDAAAAEVQRILRLAPQFPVAHYLDGLIRFERDDVTGAEAAIREVQRVAPAHPPSLYLMGAIKYRQGQHAQAEDNLQRFLAQDFGNDAAAKLLASVRFDRGDHQRAVDALEARLDATTDPQLLALYGAAQLRLGNAAQATQALERAVALAPDMAAFRNQLALSLLATGDRARAEVELNSAVAVDSEQFQSDYLLAMVRVRERDWPAAAEAVEALVQKSPDSPIGYNLRGVVAMAREDRAAAEQAFQTALHQDAGFLPAVQNLARMAEQAGDREAAVRFYEDFLAGRDDDESALLALADLAVRGSDAGAAVDYLQRAVLANPESVRARLGLSRLHFAQGQLASAGSVVSEALVLAPTMPDLLLLRAEIDLRSGNVEAARRIATDLQPQAARLPDNRALHLALGNLQARVGQLTLARTNLERALVLSDGVDATALRGLARLDLRDGRTEAARARVQQLRQAGEDDAETKLLEADVLLAENRRDEAESRFSELADAGVRDGMIRMVGLEAREDRAAATARLQTWLDDRPEDLGAQLLLADLLMRQDQERAIARYEALVETNNPVALNNLAWLYMERKDPRALATARAAVAAAPDNPDILDTLGWILLQEGQKPEAVRLLRRSVQLNPNNPSVHYHLGVALRETGDVRGARDALTRAMELRAFPEQEDARRVLEELADT